MWETAKAIVPEAIESCVEYGSGFALRACQNRKVVGGHLPVDPTTADDDCTLLFDLLEQQPMLGHKKLWVRGRKDRAARWATLEVSATALTLLAPKNWPDKAHRKHRPRPDPLKCWALRIRQVHAPEGEEPIEWLILTDEPVNNLADALKVVFRYTCRWLIEEYHKCLKSGCQVEARQLEEVSRLEALLGILTVVAVRLLQLKTPGESESRRPRHHRRSRTICANPGGTPQAAIYENDHASVLAGNRQTRRIPRPQKRR